MTFAELIVGDHFIWADQLDRPLPDAINVNIKIACGEDGGGFATDLATRKDCIDPAGTGSGEPAEWIRGETQVIKLNGRF